MSRPGNSFVYSAADVSCLLGLTVENLQPVPVVSRIEGEIVVWYGGWPLSDLRASPAGQRFMRQEDDWYDRFGWKSDPGYYRVLLRVPDSNDKTWDEQVAHLSTFDSGRWQPTPVAVAATALLAHLAASAQDALLYDWCRCLEPADGRFQAAIAVLLGRVIFTIQPRDEPYTRGWLAACRKC